MYRVYAYNLLCDFKEFLSACRKVIIVFVIVNICAICLGIKSAFSVYDAGIYLLAHPTNLINLITNKTSLFGYFFVVFLSDLTILAVIWLLSVNFILSYLSLAVTFFKSYLFALYICLYVTYFKLSFLPLLLLCLIPCYLVTIFLFIVVSALSICRARDLRLYGCGCANSFALFTRKMIIPCIVLFLISVICTTLSYFLTLGIIL